ncbi:MAG: DedA family protein [Negativicutes bacterium]
MYGFSLLEGKFVIEFGILLACALGMPAPEEIALLSAGVLVAAKQVAIHHAIISGVVGVVLSDTVLYYMRRCFGRQIFQWRFISGVLTESRVKWVEACIRGNGALVCFVGRFLPGLRMVIFTTVGVLGVKPQMFLVIDILAAVIDISFWIFVGTLMGSIVDASQYAAEIKKTIMLLGVALLLFNVIRQYMIRHQVKV